MKTKKDIKELRHDIKKGANSVTVIRRGDQRIKSPSRVCAICGQPLSNFNYTNGNVSAKMSHYQIKQSKYLEYYLCKDIKNCYKNIQRRGELVER